jgi:hypothetical protein
VEASPKKETKRTLLSFMSIQRCSLGVVITKANWAFKTEIRLKTRIRRIKKFLKKP